MIPLLLLSSCDNASESIVEETPIPPPTSTAAPTITPTITPTLGLPPDIAARFGEEVPELVKNEDGVYTAENVRWKATYENGEWEVLPRSTTCYDQQLLEAVEQEYLQRSDTPETMVEVRNQMKKDKEYYEDYNDFFGVIHNGYNMPDDFHFRSKTISFTEVNLENYFGGRHGDVGIVRVSVRPDFPERYICELVGIERDGEYFQTSILRVSKEKLLIDDKKDLNDYIGKVIECSAPPMYCGCFSRQN